MPLEMVPGRSFAWSLLNKLGEGDAGEVYWVESLLDKRKAILKRPVSSAFTSDVIRQAVQIEHEGKVLSLLSNLDWGDANLRVPGLIDCARDGTELTEKYFIVMEKAPGIDLRSLAAIQQTRAVDLSAQLEGYPQHSSGELQSFLQEFALCPEFPAYLLLQIISSCLTFLERIHSYPVTLAGEQYSGLIWNDFKPEHIFWDPVSRNITLIDWGNSNFLDSDGATSDRQGSPLNDFIQLLQTFGSFISSVSPGTFTALDWPAEITPDNVYSQGILPVKAKLQDLVVAHASELDRVRLSESDLLESSNLTLPTFARLLEVHKRIVAMGELPDYPRLEDLASRLAHEILQGRDLSQFENLSRMASEIPAFQLQNWQLLAEISSHLRDQRITPRALLAALNDDYAESLWLLRPLAVAEASIRWWEELAQEIRQDKLGASPQAVTPFTALNRLLHAILSNTMESGGQPETAGSHAETVRIIKEILIPRWQAPEPDPPASGIEYLEVQEYLPSFISLVPSAGRMLEFALEMPLSQSRIVIDAWRRQDFDLASQALRRLLLWDPDRLRLFSADIAIQSTPGWLDSLQRGPDQNEPLQDYVTRLELQGRDLRNSVGPADWLDERLDVLSRLRRESDPADLVAEFPLIRDFMGWIFELETGRSPIDLSTGPVALDRLPMQVQDQVNFHGSKETALGSEFLVISPLDSWTPEAKGSSARVFLGVIRHSRSKEVQSAVKIMRPDRLDYALPLFREEIQVLTILQDTPGVVPLHEFGFIHLEKNSSLPAEDKPGAPSDLHGRVRRYGKDNLHQFMANLDTFTQQDWLPYLAVEIQDRSENLLMLCDSSYTRGRFLPVLEGLRMAIQICDILQVAHSRNIIYRDHKILHYYWRVEDNGIMMIDWNIAKRFPAGLSKPEIQFDLVQFCARALHHILTGRPASGSLPLGPTRPEEIEAAARSYEVRWTYDDQRIPQEIKEILAAGMRGDYQDARQLRDDLFNQFQSYQPLTPGIPEPQPES